MSGSRVERVADQVKELVSQLLSFEVRDPGVGLVTVTHVKVTGDLQLAQVYYTIIGDARERKETAKALERATAFVRRRVAEDLNLRRAPELRFHYDEHVERQERVEVLLQQIAAERAARETAEPGAPAPESAQESAPADGDAPPPDRPAE
jgi:ribosome-binding factor A